MWRWVWRLGGCATLAALAVTACGKTEGSPDDQTAAAAAGLGIGGDGDGGRASGAAGTAGKSASAGAAGNGGASATGGASASGGASGRGESPPLGGGTGGSLGGAPSAAEGGAASAGGSSGCDRHYEACGCGCCSGQKVQVCVYPGVGSSFDEIIAADVARRQDTVACAAAGCSLRQDYICCEVPPPRDEGASYETSLYIGGLDRVRLHKAGAANCSTLGLVDRKVAEQKFPVELPAQWELDQITRAPCGSSATGAPAIGAIGKFNFRVSDAACVVDAHVTAFFARAEGGVDAERFDAEGVPVNLSIGQCK